VTLTRTNRVGIVRAKSVHSLKGREYLLSGHHATSYRPSLHTRRAPYLTPLLAICAPCLTPHHSCCLSFCFFFWYYRQHGGGHGQRQCCSC
jgi:hypothetical protein